MPLLPERGRAGASHSDRRLESNTPLNDPTIIVLLVGSLSVERPLINQSTPKRCQVGNGLGGLGAFTVISGVVVLVGVSVPID